ncbi:MAG TPA: sugar ABC transporter substrate-binding protein [Bacillus bacterium]|nr:sugar ABC transporter substrate-binding protein [Bacillus sp. (in: firmicutes)]
MKKRIVLLVFFALSFAFTGCQNAILSEKNQPIHNTSTMRITAVIPHDDKAYWTSVIDGITAAAEDFPVNVKIRLPSMNYSVPQMTELIKEATAARVDAIIVQGVDDPDYIKALENAWKKGIQIIFVDTDLPQFPEHLYIGTDNYAAGRLLGEKLVEETGGRARIGLISGAPGYPNLELRLQGIKDVISRYSDMSIEAIEYDQYDYITFYEKYKLLSQREYGIDTLVCIEGTGTLSMTIRGILDKRAPAFKCVIGFDFYKESERVLTEGLMDGVIRQQTFIMGYRSIEESYRYKTEGHYSHNVIHTDIDYLTASDLNKEVKDEVR